ncbi:hypothetical protein NA57DRAFT_79101 [Rhizodiscina lignyota]|uniref:Uncharacterized protein n=1 Tax=Rhizodiscina lignyota TaxID=1504668 RepID=A0A9P4IB78_9PEZI|nr:hypothetical protein NA57DRAFT_79101 [Rhizodiscina lignyota]
MSTAGELSPSNLEIDEASAARFRSLGDAPRFNENPVPRRNNRARRRHGNRASRRNNRTSPQSNQLDALTLLERMSNFLQGARQELLDMSGGPEDYEADQYMAAEILNYTSATLRTWAANSGLETANQSTPALTTLLEPASSSTSPQSNPMSAEAGASRTLERAFLEIMRSDASGDFVSGVIQSLVREAVAGLVLDEEPRPRERRRSM